MSLILCPVCRRPKLQDAYSGEGGMGAGLIAAGWCVDAVDDDPNRLKRFPRVCEGQTFTVGDAIESIHAGRGRYTARHASPPCTGYSQATSMRADQATRYTRLIAATRGALLDVGGPYVIENVVSRLTRAELINPVMLCWTHFYEPGSVLDDDGTPLWMRRHRLFETNWDLPVPGDHDHRRDVQCAGAYGGARRDKHEARHIRKGGYVPAAPVMSRLLGIDWMSEKGLQLSIPPIYAQYVGTWLLKAAVVDVAA